MHPGHWKHQTVRIINSQTKNILRVYWKRATEQSYRRCQSVSRSHSDYTVLSGGGGLAVEHGPLQLIFYLWKLLRTTSRSSCATGGARHCHRAGTFSKVQVGTLRELVGVVSRRSCNSKHSAQHHVKIPFHAQGKIKVVTFYWNCWLMQIYNLCFSYMHGCRLLIHPELLQFYELCNSSLNVFFTRYHS
jgi:hypothetical protein